MSTIYIFDKITNIIIIIDIIIVLW